MSLACKCEIVETQQGEVGICAARTSVEGAGSRGGVLAKLFETGDWVSSGVVRCDGAKAEERVDGVGRVAQISR